MTATDLTQTVAPPDEELAGWLRLQQTPDVGFKRKQALLDRFGAPQAIFSAGPDALAAVVPRQVALALCAALTAGQTNQLLIQQERCRAWLALAGNHLLTLSDPAYPAPLKEIATAPLLLYVQGNPALLSGKLLAMVGARNATLQGRSNAHDMALALSRAGLTIVSGMALGIDAASHLGGLDGPSSSIAVIGTGADIVYPPRNAALARRLAEQGCIVSEYPLGTQPASANFPRRNRIISGLSLGVLVVEAARHSGSLITARLAIDQNRDVFAVPGSIHATLSKGCHKLIKSGAKLVESADDVLAELGMPLSEGGAEEVIGERVAKSRRSALEKALLAALAYDPIGADVLVERTGVAPAAIVAALLGLELAGLIERLPGGLYQRLGAA